MQGKYHYLPSRQLLKSTQKGASSYGQAIGRHRNTVGNWSLIKFPGIKDLDKRYEWTTSDPNDESTQLHHSSTLREYLHSLQNSKGEDLIMTIDKPTNTTDIGSNLHTITTKSRFYDEVYSLSSILPNKIETEIGKEAVKIWFEHSFVNNLNEELKEGGGRTRDEVDLDTFLEANPIENEGKEAVVYTDSTSSKGDLPSFVSAMSGTSHPSKTSYSTSNSSAKYKALAAEHEKYKEEQDEKHKMMEQENIKQQKQLEQMQFQLQQALVHIASLQSSNQLPTTPTNPPPITPNKQDETPATDPPITEINNDLETQSVSTNNSNNNNTFEQYGCPPQSPTKKKAHKAQQQTKHIAKGKPSSSMSSTRSKSANNP